MSKKEIQRALFKVTGKKPPGPEAAVLSGVLQFLNLIPGCAAWRQNVGNMAVTREDGRRVHVQFGQKGMSDVSGILRGYRLEVEVKAPGNVPTPLQLAWLKFINDRGGIAFWCASVNALVVNLKVEYQKRGWVWWER